MEVRGEVYIEIESFKTLEPSTAVGGESVFANPPQCRRRLFFANWIPK